jgi:DNA-binding transcriptional ArsR family regulator
MADADADADTPRAHGRRRVGDLRALNALAHPLRLALLDTVMSFGPRTATECAEVVGSTPSNCSYHLRYLARYGLVEPVDRQDGRERPWRATAAGFQFDSGSASPAARAAEAAVAAVQVDEHARLAHAFIRRADDDPTWRQASNFSAYGLLVTPDELRQISEEIDAIVRPYRAMVRDDAPDGAAPVHVSVTAFRHPEAP